MISIICRRNLEHNLAPLAGLQRCAWRIARRRRGGLLGVVALALGLLAAGEAARAAEPGPRIRFCRFVLGHAKDQPSGSPGRLDPDPPLLRAWQQLVRPSVTASEETPLWRALGDWYELRVRSAPSQLGLRAWARGPQADSDAPSQHTRLSEAVVLTLAAWHAASTLRPSERRVVEKRLERWAFRPSGFLVSTPLLWDRLQLEWKAERALLAHQRARATGPAAERGSADAETRRLVIQLAGATELRLSEQDPFRKLMRMQAGTGRTLRRAREAHRLMALQMVFLGPAMGPEFRLALSVLRALDDDAMVEFLLQLRPDPYWSRILEGDPTWMTGVAERRALYPERTRPSRQSFWVVRRETDQLLSALEKGLYSLNLAVGSQVAVEWSLGQLLPRPGEGAPPWDPRPNDWLDQRLEELQRLTRLEESSELASNDPVPQADGDVGNDADAGALSSDDDASTLLDADSDEEDEERPVWLPRSEREVVAGRDFLLGFAVDPTLLAIDSSARESGDAPVLAKLSSIHAEIAHALARVQHREGYEAGLAGARARHDREALSLLLAAAAAAARQSAPREGPDADEPEASR